MHELDIGARQAAELIVGQDSSPLRDREIDHVLHLMRSDYEHALRALDILIETTCEVYARELKTHEVEQWAKDSSNLLSADMRRCLSNFALDKRGATLVGWYDHSPTAFDDQSFFPSDVRLWFDGKDVQFDHRFGAEAGGHAIEARGQVSAAVSWTVRMPKRCREHIRCLCEFLKKEQLAGKACPTVQDVFDYWNKHPQPGLRVTDSHVNYDTLGGKTLSATRKAIGQAIRSHVVFSPLNSRSRISAG